MPVAPATAVVPLEMYGVPVAHEAVTVVPLVMAPAAGENVGPDALGGHEALPPEVVEVKIWLPVPKLE